VSRPEAPLRPKVRRSIRARGGRHVTIEGFGRNSPAYLTIGGASDVPVGAWLSPKELRRFIEAAKKILR